MIRNFEAWDTHNSGQIGLKATKRFLRICEAPQYSHHGFQMDATTSHDMIWSISKRSSEGLLPVKGLWMEAITQHLLETLQLMTAIRYSLENRIGIPNGRVQTHISSCFWASWETPSTCLPLLHTRSDSSAFAICPRISLPP